MQQEDLNNKEELQEESMQQEAMNKEVQQKAMNKEVQQEAMNKKVQQEAINKTNEKFTHEEQKITSYAFWCYSWICYNVDFEINLVELNSRINSSFAHSCTISRLMRRLESKDVLI